MRQRYAHRELGCGDVDRSVVLADPDINPFTLLSLLGSTNTVRHPVMNVTGADDLVLSQGNKLLIAGDHFKARLRPRLPIL